MKPWIKGVMIFLGVIFLIAGTLLWIEAAEPCAFNACSGVVKVVTLEDGTLYAGSIGTSTQPRPSLMVSFNNPSDVTYITSLSMWKDNQTVFYGNSTSIVSTITRNDTIQITTWQGNGNLANQINFSVPLTANSISSAAVTTLTFFPRISSSITIARGQVWDYSIDFANGQGISGSLIAEWAVRWCSAMSSQTEIIASFFSLSHPSSPARSAFPCSFLLCGESLMTHPSLRFVFDVLFTRQFFSRWSIFGNSPNWLVEWNC